MQNNIIFDDALLNKFDKNLYEIPDDVKRKIYTDYFQPQIESEELCKELLINLKTHKSYILCIEDIIPYIKKILKNELAIKYLIKNNKIFEDLYTDIVIHNKKNFIHLGKEEDLALSWLFMLYH
jgi:hypothetical protein